MCVGLRFWISGAWGRGLLSCTVPLREGSSDNEWHTRTDGERKKEKGRVEKSGEDGLYGIAVEHRNELSEWKG